jgi:predicted short-subunit dehydrogenase-like oxidoreductase (DUF2520 family)
MAARKLKLGFVGAGRVGTALATAFARSGCKVVAVASRSGKSARTLAKRLRGARACSAQEVADLADLVFLTVPDDAIAAAAAGIRWRKGTACVHCSGAAELDVLAKAAADGALTGGFHPLRMFGKTGQDFGLRGYSVAIAGPDALERRLSQLARAVGARPLRVPAGGRALYHIAANFSGAFVVGMMAESVDLLRRIGIAEKDAVRALLPLLRGTADNVEKLGAAGGLGSAVARGDVATIRKHLQALREHPQTLELYRLLSLRTVPLAVAKGTLKPERAEEIKVLLLEATGKGSP